MSEFFLERLSPEDVEFDGFFDGKQKFIPEGTVLDIVVTDAFLGMEEGSAMQEVKIFVAVTTPGEFLGQKYIYRPKFFDVDAGKRDKATKNLQLLDTQAGSPLSTNRYALNTENMQEFWVGKAYARAKFGVYDVQDRATKEPTGEQGNYIAGFGFLRSKIPATQQALAENDQQPNAVSKEPAESPEKDDDIGF